MKWQLVRCFYDPDRCSYNAIDDPEMFSNAEETFRDYYGELGYCLGVAKDFHDGQILTHIVTGETDDLIDLLQ